MAYRYPEEYFKSDDVATPRDWLVNVREFTDEFNGALDRDNLPDSGINETRIVDHTFTDVEETVFTSSVTPDADTTQWQDVTSVTYDTTSDPEILQCEFSCWWSWADVSISGSDLRCQRGVRFRITVDGYVIAETGLLSRWHRSCSTYLVGAIPIPAGEHTIKAEVQCIGERTDTLANPPTYRSIPNVPDIEEGSLLIIARRR